MALLVVFAIQHLVLKSSLLNNQNTYQDICGTSRQVIMRGMWLWLQIRLIFGIVCETRHPTFSIEGLITHQPEHLSTHLWYQQVGNNKKNVIMATDETNIWNCLWH